MQGLLKKIVKAMRRFGQYADRSTVLVYQMGKVGSSSLEQSIPDAIHVHTMHMNGPCSASDKRIYRGIFGFIRHWGRDFLRRTAIRLKQEVRIITVVRNPVDRNISMFFQGLSFWMDEYIENFERETRHADMSWLAEVYKCCFPHSYCDEWFDKEILKLTGIDVFSRPFDCVKGMSIYKRDKYAVLVVRMEDIEKNIHDIGEFVGYPIQLKRVNEASGKWYAGVYKEFKDSVDRQWECIKVVERGRVARHFGYGDA